MQTAEGEQQADFPLQCQIEKPMSRYRLYHVKDGHFFRGTDIWAETDKEAIAQAIEMRGPEPAELWCGERKVTIFTASEGGGPT